MRLITVHIPQKWLDLLDELVAAGLYPNRSEIIRLAIREFLKNEPWLRERRRTENQRSA